MDNKYEPCDIILLSLIFMDSEYGEIVTWNESHHSIMRKHKNNIIISESMHHGLPGYY